MKKKEINDILIFTGVVIVTLIFISISFLREINLKNFSWGIISILYSCTLIGNIITIILYFLWYWDKIKLMKFYSLILVMIPVNMICTVLFFFNLFIGVVSTKLLGNSIIVIYLISIFSLENYTGFKDYYLQNQQIVNYNLPPVLGVTILIIVISLYGFFIENN